MDGVRPPPGSAPLKSLTKSDFRHPANWLVSTRTNFLEACGNAC